MADEYQIPIIGDSPSLYDLGSRISQGALPLLAYGVAGGLQQALVAPTQGQIPLAFGFTSETPWAAPEAYYDIGVPGQDQSLQISAQLAGQRVVGSPVRTHTTGLLDYAVRHDYPFAIQAMELIHPGRALALYRERGERGQLSEQAPSLVPATTGVVDSLPHFTGVNYGGRKSRRFSNGKIPCFPSSSP